MPASTQSFLPLKEIKDGVIVQKNGNMSSVLAVSSFNFALKAEEEQEAILLGFEGFLNSLEVSAQIQIQSRKFNARPYLEYISGFLEKQTNDLLRIQTKEYKNFIESFVKNTEIITKDFFVIITYTPISISNNKGFFFKKEDEKEKTFEEHRTQLAQRTSFVQETLGEIGLRSSPLNTEELTELLYKSFNPGDTQKPVAAL